MTQYRTQWPGASIADISGAPVGWTLHDAAYASVERGSPFGRPPASVVFRTPVKSQFLRVHPGDAADFRCVAWDALEADPDAVDVEFIALLMPAVDDPIWHVYTRGQGATPSSFYRLAVDKAAGEVRLEKYASATLTVIDTVAVTIASGVAHWARFRVDGTSIQAVVWPVSEAEPATWQAEAIDSTVTAAGWSALGGQTSGSGAFAEFNIVAAATGGEAAVRPITDAEWMAWADRQDVLRTVCVKLNAVAFAPCTEGLTKHIPIYISDSSYTSKPWDDPANVGFIHCLEKAPAVTREISQAMAGRARTSVGSLVVTNPGGLRNAWLDWLWAKDGVEVLLGDPEWPLADFRPLVVGSLRQQPTGADGRITFELADRSGVLDVPFTTTTIGGTGSQANAFMPDVIGSPVYADVDTYDASTYTYQVASQLDGAIASHEVYDNGNLLQTTGTMASADAGTDVITASAAHGMVVGYTLMWDVGGAGTPPSPLAEGVEYYIQSVPALNQFKLSATPGGAAINLTDAGTGNPPFTAWGWELQASSGRIKLAANPADPRIMVRALSGNFVGHAGFAAKALLVDRGALTGSDFALGFDNVGNGIESGLRVAAESTTMGAVIERVFAGINGWFGWTPDGLLDGGRLGLPDPDDVVMSFTQHDIVAASLAWKVAPIRREAMELQFNRRNYTRGVPQYATNADVFGQEYTVAARLSAAPVATPLESFVVEPRRENVFPTTITDTTDAEAERDRLADLYGRELGAYKFVIRNLRAALIPQGRTVQIEYSPLGWQVWDADTPASPDNAGEMDARLGVVLSVKPDPVARTVELLVVRRMVKRWITFRPDLPPFAFSADLVATVVPEVCYGAPSFTRASTRSFTDYLGAGGTAGSGEVAFQGARRTTPAAGTVDNYARHTEEYAGSSWSGSAQVVSNAAADSNGILAADTVTDSSAVAFELRQQTVSIPDDSSTWYVVQRVKKTTGGTSKTMFVNVDLLGGGTPVAVSARFNSDLGTELGAPASIIEDDGGHWIYKVPIANNGTGNTTLQIVVYPSAAPYNSTAVDTAETGTVTLSRLQVVPGAAVPYRAVGNVYPYYGAMVDQVQYHADTPDGDAISWTVLKGVVVNTATASDVLTYPTPGNVPAPSFAVALDWSPQATGMGTVWLWASYVDASNYTALLHDGTNLIARKRIAGVNHDATIALTVSTSDTFRCAARFSETQGVDVFLDGDKGSNASNTAAPQIGAMFGLGNDGNGTVVGSHCFRRLAICPGDLNDEQMTDFSK